MEMQSLLSRRMSGMEMVDVESFDDRILCNVCVTGNFLR